MSVRHLENILKPRRIALFGVGAKSSDLGTIVLGNLLSSHFDGVIYPIQKDCEAVHGVPTYDSLEQLPRIPDLAIVCNPAAEVAGVVRECGEYGVNGVLIISGGFRETGGQGQKLEQELLAVTEQYPEMRILGPNSLGIIHPSTGLNASHAVTMPQKGHLAFISESRSLCNSVLDWATDEGIGLSCFVSTGNRMDIGYGDLIDYFGNDPETRAIILYLQSINHARSFMSAARAFALQKPIVVYKAGRFEQSAKVAASHTGNLVAEDAVYEAAFERAGIVRVMELDDIFDMAEVLASHRLPKGSRLAIVSNAGGPAVIASDALLLHEGTLATLTEASVQGLDQVLPPVGSHQNPVDLLDGAPADRYQKALPIVLQDEGVDAALVIFATQSGSDPQAVARAVIDTMETSSKPIFVALMGGEKIQDALRLCNRAGLPTHRSPEQAVRAFVHLVSHARNLEDLYRTPREIKINFSMNRRKLRERLQPLLKTHHHSTENQARAFLKAYEIPVCESIVGENVEQTVAAANKIGYPVVLKVLSPEIIHKVDVGGVALNLENEEAVRLAYESVVKDTRTHRADANVMGVCVQKMLSSEQALEMILGAKKDPTFGSVIMIGIGGIAAGLIKDWAVGLPPLNERLVRRMLESLRSWPMLNGFRGLLPVNIDRLVEIIIRFSLLIADYPMIREFEINPLLVSADDVVALDAVMILEDEEQDLSDSHPHLAIRPYPEDYVRHWETADGEVIKLRSVRAEDEPYWHKMISSSSEESIRFRFRSVFRQPTHAMAILHCMIDHERQISIVAETGTGGNKELVGIAQLIADANHDTAEFAVLVPDPWQGKRIGGMLLDYSIELARTWGIRSIEAETDPFNQRMLTSFRKRGFSTYTFMEDKITMAKLNLEQAVINEHSDN